jgi:hypothetical protein
MKTIELYTKTDYKYAEVCAFARRIYARQLSFTITHFPEYFFAVTEGEEIMGCIGLNSTIRSPLFLNDPRIQDVIKQTGPNVHFCEQSIFALDRYSLGVPLLIAVITEFAESLGAQKLVYAGVDVSRKTIARLGFEVKECGPTDITAIPLPERTKYMHWQQAQHPVTCVLSTKGAALISSRTFNTYAHKVKKSKRLITVLLTNTLHACQKESA